MSLLQVGVAGASRLPRVAAPTAGATGGRTNALAQAAFVAAEPSAPTSVGADGAGVGASAANSSAGDGSASAREARWLRFGIPRSLLQTVVELKEGDSVDGAIALSAGMSQQIQQSSAYPVTLLLIGGVAITGAIIVGLVVRDQWRSSQVPPDPEMQKQLMGVVQPSLCGEALIVPKAKRFECTVSKGFCQARQNETCDVKSSPQRGSRPVFKVLAVEGKETNPRILIEGHHNFHDGGQPLAYVQTAPLYEAAGNSRVEPPKLNFYNGKGEYFGCLQQRGQNYEMHRGPKRLMIFSGDFEAHDVKVAQVDGTLLGRATPMPLLPECYQVVIASGVDAGAVILGLLAIDKCEIPPEIAPGIADTTAPGESMWS